MKMKQSINWSGFVIKKKILIHALKYLDKNDSYLLSSPFLSILVIAWSRLLLSSHVKVRLCFLLWYSAFNCPRAWAHTHLRLVNVTLIDDKKEEGFRNLCPSSGPSLAWTLRFPQGSSRRPWQEVEWIMPWCVFTFSSVFYTTKLKTNHTYHRLKKKN